jgi:DNA polymerase bacteriophage-type
MDNLIDFHFDFETRSRIDLKAAGTVRYATDPSTEATLLTWCFGRTGSIKYWSLGNPVPAELIDVATNPDKYRFNAFNIGFDYLIWTLVFSRVVPGLVRPKIQNLEDTMAISCHFRMGGSLDATAMMMGLPYTKDKEGRRIMLKQCKPNAKGEFPTLTEDELEKFINYGIIDTRILRDVYYRMPPLPSPERWAWEWTMRRNLRGIRLDTDLVDEMQSIINETMPKLVHEFDLLVGGKVKINSPKCKDYFKQYYPWIENMQADTVRDMLASDIQVHPSARRALEIKDLAGSTSLAKVKCAVEQQYAGRIYNVLSYHYAHTKRWAGRGIQIQNFPRVDDKKIDSIDFDLDTEDLASLVRAKRHTLKDPLGFVKNLLRRIWLPEPGQMFYCGDFSRVEPSVMYWLLDLGDIPPKWYEEMAAEIYNVPVSEIAKDSEERTVGKSANLGCGYGMGPDKFKADTAKKTGIILSDDMARQVVFTYRRKNSAIVNFWKDIEWAFRRAVLGEPTTLCNRRVHVMPMPSPHKGVQIRLPSGSHLYYHNARIDYETTDKGTREILTYATDEGGILGRSKLYGGLLTEHIVSATARDILVPAMWRLENAGFDVLNVVHDEIWAQAEDGRAQEFKKLMCINPSWCNMKIDADLKCGKRYLK